MLAVAQYDRRNVETGSQPNHPNERMFRLTGMDVPVSFTLSIVAILMSGGSLLLQLLTWMRGRRSLLLSVYRTEPDDGRVWFDLYNNGARHERVLRIGIRNGAATSQLTIHQEFDMPVDGAVKTWTDAARLGEVLGTDQTMILRSDAFAWAYTAAGNQYSEPLRHNALQSFRERRLEPQSDV